ncbi:HNH endonuclease [Mucilaginibacter pedocola]|uniref:HNH nuclease domain-containing protein n=1 Tax=Mucilaginibacter pedocola TaxID=1792845 RepID=A0A1S9PLD5_9SPHI|nr:HNH endonuclease [Mucilaginibacter pedocola]OOQ61776.1 hypothetical protein BC343_01525 [Mucilaginibacter pedocola]
MTNEFLELYISAFDKKAHGREYYFVSVKPQSEDITYAAFFSLWIRYREDIKPNISFSERRICSVDPEIIRRNFKGAGEQVAIIDNKKELTASLYIGGHFLIEDDVMKENWSEILAPKIIIQSYSHGIIDYNIVAKPQLARFAKGKLRMEIMTRDGLCCRVCGKSPDDERYLTLEVHHIKPWEEGGITEPSNLITLCNLCHEGITEVDRKLLWKKVGVDFQFQNHLIYKNAPTLTHVIDNAVQFKIDKKMSP